MADPDPANISLSNVDPNGIQILGRTDYISGVPISIGDLQWVPFVTQVPPQIITVAQVSRV